MAERSNPSPAGFSLAKLRENLNDMQRRLLNRFWKHYLDNGVWPFTFDEHRKRPKSEMAETLRAIGGNPDRAGNIVRENHSPAGMVYELTLVGILLTSNGEKYQRLLTRLVSFLRREYFHGRKEGRNIEFDDAEIAQALKLDGEERVILGKLTHFDSVYRSHGHTVGGQWRIRLPDEIQEIPKRGPLDKYYEAIVFKYFGNQNRVFQNEVKPKATSSFDGSDEPDFGVSAPPKNSNGSNAAKVENAIKIFISHSSEDERLVEVLTDLIRTAFRLSANEILCTSISGHKLSGGSDIEHELLASLHGSVVLIGVLTPASLGSSYVLFELGARWGLRKPLISMVASGTKMTDIKEPLKSLVALDASNEDDVHQLIQDIAELLNEKSEATASYSRKIRQFVSESKKIHWRIGDAGQP